MHIPFTLSSRKIMGSAAISLLSVFAFIRLADFNPAFRPSNGLHRCQKNLSVFALEVLPGGGWDNLRSIDMGRVMNITYSQCQTTEDGIYLIPDETFVIPKKESSVEMNSEIIKSWLEQESSTSRSINAEASFLALINGKFSDENKRMKTHQLKDKSVTARVQVRYHLYTVKSYPDFTLDAHFARQAEEIADAILNNQTRQAAYLSEKMVLDYGTHVIMSVDAGAILMDEVYLKSSYVTDSQTSQSFVTAQAGLKFLNKTKFGIFSKESEESPESRNYSSNIMYSVTLSYGGDLFYPGITLQKWQEGTLNNLVAIDRSGPPLYLFINPSTFPDLPLPTVNEVAQLVRIAIERYYKINTHPGCVDPNSKNFNFQANVDDASCDGPSTNFSFGGVYQKCTPLTESAETICQELSVKNPATGSYSCQDPYTANLLRSEMQERPDSKIDSREKCSGFWPFKKCVKEYETSTYVKRAQVETYWCATNNRAPEFSGYLFGGLFGPFFQNPLTKSRSCPLNFFPLTFLYNGINICLSNDFEVATRVSVPFGGFFSCQSPNLFAGNQSRCPKQFSQHLLVISDGCQVVFCVHSGIFTGGELSIHLPPFTRPPVISVMATNTVFVMNEGNQTWVRFEGTKIWKVAQPEDTEKISEMFKDPQPQSVKQNIIGIVCGAGVLIAVFLVILAVVKMRKRYSSLH